MNIVGFLTLGEYAQKMHKKWGVVRENNIRNRAQLKIVIALDEGKNLIIVKSQE